MSYRHLTLILLATLLTACSTQQQTEPDEEPTQPAIGKRALHYKVTLDEERKNTLRIEAAFLAGDTATTDFVVPTRSGDTSAVSELTATSKGTEIGEQKDNGLYPIRHEPESVVRVTYRVNGLPSPSESTSRYGPYILEHGAYFEGRDIFGHPKQMHPGLERSFEIDWSGLPDDWTVVNSFDATERLHELETALGAVQRAMYLAGDIEMVERPLDSGAIDIALLGSLGAPIEQMTDVVVEIIEDQRAFWPTDDTTPLFLALFAPESCCWSTATTKYHALAGIIAQEKPGPAQNALVDHVAHEYLHRWIPAEMGSPRPFNAYAWFVEGFTEFYARRFEVQTGFTAPSAYVEEINQLLKKYANSPVRDATRTEVNQGFRRNTDLTQLAYMRGELLALNWNAAIREATGGDKSLDDAMRRLVEMHAADDEARLNDEAIAKAIDEIAPDATVEPMIEKHIDEGEPVAVADNALGPCARKIEADGGPVTFEPVDGINESEKCRAWLSLD